MKLKAINTKFFIISAFLILISSCTKDVTNLKLPEYEPKLVLSSFISPDLDAIKLRLVCNSNTFGKLLQTEPPGRVSILLSNSIDELKIDTNLLDSESNDIIMGNMHVKEGDIFSITVQNEKGLSAKASCSVPVKRNFHIEVDTSRIMNLSPSGKLLSTLTVKISITDFPGENNYYRMLISGKSYGDKFVNEMAANYDVGDLVFSDKGRDGKKFVLRSITFFSTEASLLSRIDSSFLRIYLLNTDKSYYDYHQSLLSEYLADSNPFSEPVPLYSNVSNGVGILASYTVDSLIFRVR